MFSELNCQASGLVKAFQILSLAYDTVQASHFCSLGLSLPKYRTKVLEADPMQNHPNCLLKDNPGGFLVCRVSEGKTEGASRFKRVTALSKSSIDGKTIRCEV